MRGLEESARFSDDAVADGIQRAANERTSSLRVPTTAEAARERVDVHLPRAAERDLHLIVPQIAEEDGETGARDGTRMLGESIQLVGAHIVTLERSGRERDP